MGVAFFSFFFSYKFLAVHPYPLYNAGVFDEKLRCMDTTKFDALPVFFSPSVVSCLQRDLFTNVYSYSKVFPFMLRFSYIVITKSFLFCRNRSIDRTLHLSKKVSVTLWVKIMMRPLNKSAALLTSHRELNKTELQKIM